MSDNERLSDRGPSDGRHWAQAQELFARAMELPQAERTVFLKRQARDDPELYQEVAALLAAEASSRGWLEAPADASGSLLASDPEMEVGSDVGPYRLLRLLGEGGMGVVYEAAQREPVRRRVALKLIHVGLRTREVLARFELERQALALMSHSNIARVLDAGSSADGRPFFVMELVEGQPITDYCDRNRLTIRERLRLFSSVCRAVQHAHQKGVIHRDLKSSNVLVAVENGRPVAKVIDFGVAKAIDQRLTEKTLFTELGRIVGTPESMSPEQARMDPDIDTRTDVYSLGVLLYELLSGSPPFRFKGSSYSEIQRIIGEEEPPRPSARVTQIDQAPAVAAARRTDVRVLRRELRRELDWIVLKALEKDRGRRYETARDLAADIDRYLADQPIEAGPPGATYRARKFVRRHRIGVTAVAAAALALIAFSGMTAVQSSRVARQRDRAQRVSSFLIDLFRVSDPSRARGNSITAREILDRGAARITSGLAGEDEIQATLLDTMGQVYTNLGLYAQAQPLLLRALTLRRKTAAARDDPAVADSLVHVATVLSKEGHAQAAEAMLREAFDLRQRLFGRSSAEVADCLRRLGIEAQAENQFAKAERLYGEALAIERRALGPVNPEVADTLLYLGALKRTEGEYDAAEGLLRQALSISRQAGGAKSPQSATIESQLARVLQSKGAYGEAEREYRAALNLRRKIFGDEHPDVAASLNALATLRYDRGDAAGAEPLYRQALAIQEKALGKNHPRLASTLNNLALVLQHQHQDREAEALFRRALAINREAYGEEHWKVAGNLVNLGRLLHQEDRFDDARKLYLEALSIQRKVLGREHPHCAYSLSNLGRLAYDRG
ncbi:MAG TPA: serine/threonine-protein kinase, partial [Thermoanaerobaculia bacterium]|nr:serine/threonine-protein kinase [Thermoanaerobaculia bacterium]